MFNRLHHAIRKYFGISRTETNGVFVLILIMLFVLFSPLIYNDLLKGGYSSFISDSKKLDSMVQIMQIRLDSIRELSSKEVIDVEKSQYSVSYQSQSKKSSGYIKHSKDQKFNLNTVDSSELRSIYGIGKVLSARIIKYRELLGGFSNINQLDNVYGLRGNSLENVMTAVYVDSLFVPDKMRINFCEWKDFVRHPYINSELANDIIRLRSTKGYLKGIHDLKDITYLNDSILNLLLPYFEF